MQWWADYLDSLAKIKTVSITETAIKRNAVHTEQWCVLLRMRLYLPEGFSYCPVEDFIIKAKSLIPCVQH